MQSLIRPHLWLAAAALLIAAPAMAQKKPLDHSVYDSWNAVRQRSISDNGKYVAFTVAPQEGDGYAEVKTTDGKSIAKIERGTGLRFTADSRFVVMTVTPKQADVDKAREEKKKPADMPKNDLLIIELANGNRTTINRVATWSMPSEDNGWLIYREEDPPTSEGDDKKEDPPTDGLQQEEEKKQDAQAKKRANHREGQDYKLYEIATKRTVELEDVASFDWSTNGKTLAYAVSTKTGEGDALIAMTMPSMQKVTVMEGMAVYGRLTVHEDGDRIAFTSDKDTYSAKEPKNPIYVWVRGRDAKVAVKDDSPGMRSGWEIAGGSLRFSEHGRRLYFATRPTPEPDPPKPKPEDEVKVDIWHWQDPVMQPEQLLQAGRERNRTYQAVYHVESGKVVPLESEMVQSVNTAGTNSDNPFFIGSDPQPYLMERSWGEWYSDYYLVSAETGQARRIISKMTGSVLVTPTGKWVLATDEENRKLMTINVQTGEVINQLTPAEISFFDELNDRPNAPGFYGLAGFNSDDSLIFVYDRYDIWAFDPSGKNLPYCVTGARGRRYQTVYRREVLDRENPEVSMTKPEWLSVFNERTKASGWATCDFSSESWPNEVVMMDMSLGNLTKAKNTDDVIYSRQTFEEYPNVWASTLSFANSVKLSEANPQQKEYNWGTAELVEWRSNDGEPLQGILVKPENFEYGKKYPMVVYFYERSSDGLHSYRTPAPSASTINWSLFASNEYIVFCPDIPYKVGYPGESAISAIMPGVNEVLSMGFVDPKRMGLQGQSWGGYQIAYMITETDAFACAWAGAPVSNMFSAYGGIRWGSGLVRSFQYEKTQSRIGGSIWEYPLRYLENSPIFFVDKIKTPLVIMANDKDGAVPWYQGIEMFSAMRRLGKPAWMLVYNDEDHNLVQRKNRKDLSIRLSQFFDHYLKGEPMPVWMESGVPATMKGRTMGTEIPGQEKKSEQKSGG